MGQVPQKKYSYLIIGAGRAAKHFQHYLTLLNLSVETWSRKNNSPAELEKLASDCDRYLLLISDSQIAEFVKTYSFLRNRRTVHFSGSISVEEIANVHPLMTFSEILYSKEDYQKIQFAVFKDNQSLEEILPGLPNPSFYVPEEKKALYHALCVASGNLTTLLWQMTIKEFTDQLHVEPQILWPYLERISQNIMSQHESALTGPFVRRDLTTLNSNVKALNHSPLKEIYLSFLKGYDSELYQKTMEKLL